MSVIGSVLGQRTFLNNTTLYGGMIQCIGEITWDKRFKLAANVIFMLALR